MILCAGCLVTDNIGHATVAAATVTAAVRFVGQLDWLMAENLVYFKFCK